MEHTRTGFHKGPINTNNVPVADLLCVFLKRMKRSYVKFSRKTGKDPYLGKKRRREKEKTKKTEDGLEDEYTYIASRCLFNACLRFI